MAQAQSDRSSDLARTIFQVLALGALIATAFWIMRPFLIALVWAATVAIATWPLLLRAQAWLGGKRAPAVALMTVVLLLILLAPVYFAVTVIADNVEQITSWSKSLASFTLAGPPGWVREIPLLGARIALRWQQLASAGPDELSARLAPVVRSVALWFLSQVGNAGLLVVQFLLTTIIAAIFYARGEIAARGAERFARRLAGAEGVKAIHLAAQAIKGVALGIVVTAIAQAIVAGIGLLAAGVPLAGILTAIIFILAVAQIGPGPVLLCAVIWTYSRSGAIWGTAFLIYAIFCGTFDNFLRPLLIKRGADLPLLLIFAGVIGGLIAFGVIGLFIGPVVLAVAYTLLADWVTDGETAPPAPDAAP